MLGKRKLVSCAICAVVGLAVAETGANAEAPAGFTRKILQKTEYPGRRFVCVLAEVDIEPNGVIPRHTHPGVESSYLTSGSFTLSVQGQNDRVVKAGEGFQVPPETPHSVRNGPQASRIAVTFIVEKDKPLSSPA
jgi:quercetin dioxygenase-like cupin family protein